MKYTFTLLFLFLISIVGAKAQKADSIKQVHIKYLSATLGVSDQKAKDVAFIIDNYKEKARQLLADKNLPEDVKKLKFSQLIDDKNAKLKKALTEQQLLKIVPASELKKESEAPSN